MQYVSILDKDSTEVSKYPVDNDQIYRACLLTAELHNRDTIGDEWTVTLSEEADK